MSAASGSSASAPSLRRLPFTIRLAPSFVNPLILAPAGQPPPAAIGPGGLLFGVPDNTSIIVRQAFPRDLRTGSVNGEHAIEAAIKAALSDADLKALALVGWYVLRPAGGLLESDIEFHNRYFPRTADLAAVIRPEGLNDIVCELYCRSVEGLLSAEGHRWGSLRLTRQKPLEESAEVTMRSHLRDDFFLRTYQQPYDAADEASPAVWRRTLDRLRRGLHRSGDTDLPAPPPVAPPFVSTDTSDDMTREMPRELAWKALGKDPPVSLDTTNGRTAPVKTSAQLLSEPTTQLATRQNLLPVTAEAPPQKKGGLSWVSVAAIFGLAAAATFAVVHYRLLPAGSVASAVASSPLGLKLEGQGDRILVTWNRNSAQAQGAAGGRLVIDDGAQHRSLTLDASQLLNGSVLYTPSSADITFRLQIDGRDGKQTNETLRVLDASRTNNDGIKVLTMDGRAATPPFQAAKPLVNRRAPAALPTGNPAATGAAKPSARASGAAELQGPAASSAASEVLVQGHATDEGVAGSTPSSSSEEPSETVVAPSTAATPQAAASIPDKPVVTPAEIAPPSQGAAVLPSALSSYRPPQPVNQVTPNLRLLPMGLVSANAQVEVTVNIDRQGRVVAARLANTSGQVSSALSSAALGAARNWTFKPAFMNGQSVASEHSIIFSFKPPAR